MNITPFWTSFLLFILTICVGQGQLIPGFTYIGQWRNELRPNNVAAISYYISSELASQQEALLACQEMLDGGRLVTPVDRSQYDAVIQGLMTATDPGVMNSMIWTAGQHNGDSSWFWLTNGQEIGSDSLFWAQSFPVGSKGHGLSIVFYPPNIGYGDSFGVTSSRKFICEIDQ